jgi:hypothetical protein
VKGSPELEKTLRFKARLGRKMVTQTLQPTGNGKTPPDAQGADSGAFDDPGDSGEPEPSFDPETGEIDDGGPELDFGAES